MALEAQEPLSIASYSLSCALGMTRDAVAKRLFAGENGLVPPPFALPFTTLCGALPEALPPLPPTLARFETRQARLAYATLAPLLPALQERVARYGRERVAVVLGSSNAGLDTTERTFGAYAKLGQAPDVAALRDQHAYSAVLALIEALTGIAGPMLFVSTACSSSGKAFASAARLLRSGLADAALVGGVDALCEMTVRGFRSLGVLAEGACRPFCRERSGINIGEGAALFVLERGNDAELQLLGYGEGADAPT